MSLSTQVNVNIGAALSGTVGLATVQAPLSFIKSLQLASGTAADQADKVYSQAASIAGGGDLSLDLAGSLEDALGAAFALAKLKVIAIYSRPGNTTDLTLFGDAASVPILNTAATTITLKPGGLFLYFTPAAAGIAVTPTTGDVVKIANGVGAAAAVDVILIGTSA